MITLFDAAREYTSMSIGGVVFNVPFYVNRKKDLARGDIFPGKGKASAAEIKKFLEDKAVPPVTLGKLKSICSAYRVGIDCSGFIYRVYERYLEDKGTKLEDRFISWQEDTLSKTYDPEVNDHYSCYVDTLLIIHSLNSYPIEKDEARVGDLVVFRNQFNEVHCGVLVLREGENFLYTHSSLGMGAHLDAVSVDFTDWSEKYYGKIWVEVRRPKFIEV